MSKYVKGLVSGEISKRLEGVSDALLVNVIGLESNKTVALRRQFRDKDIQLMVVKNSLAKRATEGTPLAPAFEGIEGTLAVVWGSEDTVSLVKEVTKFHDDKEYGEFQARGGVMDGEQLTPEKIKEISKWPSRDEQISILVGQIVGPGSALNSQLLSMGSALASQIKKKSEGEETS